MAECKDTGPDGPHCFAKILADEYQAIRGGQWGPDIERGEKWDATSKRNLFYAMDQQSVPLSALCISGGGIRSATFALGAIQALAEKGILAGLDYLSTVSGGGYIGGWLTAWKQREGGLDPVLQQLQPIAPKLKDETIDPVQHLREFNNYLTPKLGLFSTDTWTLAAIISRNMVLNWLVLWPILLFVLIIPRLVLAIARLGVTSPGLHDYAAGAILYLVPVVSALLFAIGIFNALCYLPGVGRQSHTEFDFLKYCLLPFIGSAVTFVAFDAWFDSSDAGHSAATLPTFRDLMMWITISAFAGWIAYLAFDAKSAWRKPKKVIFGLTATVVLVGFTTACGAWLLTAKFYQDASWGGFVSLAAPLLLLAFMSALVLFVGLTSNLLLDEDREWLSKAAAWMLLFIFSWLIICVLSLLAPEWLMNSGVIWKRIVAIAGTVGGGISALGGLSSKTKVQTGGAQQVTKQGALIDVAAKLAAPVFVAAFLTGLAILTDWLLYITGALAGTGTQWWQHKFVIENTHATSILWLGLGFLGFGLLMGHYININKFSLHGMYRNRLIRAYLGASGARADADKFTGFAESDNLQMHELSAKLKPFHVFNMTLNLVHSTRLAWQQRKAESFTVSPLYSGHCTLGYRPSVNYGGHRGISLGTAITISGAAASPNMGYHSSPVIGFIMTLFNARLGAWLGNPGDAGKNTWQLAGPRYAIGSLIREAFGLTNDTSKYVYLSDGGHFENLALYEMVRRGCRNIVVLDSGCDLEFKFEDLGNALRKIRIDQKIPIEFGDSLRPLLDKKARFAVAKIRYSLLDPKRKDGCLLYIKPNILGGEPPDITAYKLANGDFPHQSTSNQWFNESQTESYRMLGIHTVNEICGAWNGQGGLEGLFAQLCDNAPAQPSARPAGFEQVA